MITLRPYQSDLLERAREALRRFMRILVVSPTGSGKTALLVYMMWMALQKGKRSMFIVHQNELLEQTSRALWAQGLEHGFIASGKPASSLPVNVASLQTLRNRLDAVEAPDLIIFDEAHRAAAGSYEMVANAFPNARIIGLTATPQRTDGKGLGAMFDHIVEGLTIRELIDMGFLCDYEIFAPPSLVDTSNIKRTMGDFNKSQLDDAVNKPKITGDAVSHYKALTAGKRCVVMCINIKHANNVCQQYQDAGIPAAVIEGTMSDKERGTILEQFASGEILVVCNVQLLVEGVDIPAIEVVQWLRPTQSLIVFMQGNGRGLRPHVGKDKLIILDHVQNVQRHGLPCDMREWSLDGEQKKKRKKKDEVETLSVRTCKECFAVYSISASHCPSCGAVTVKSYREIEVEQGQLEAVNMDMLRRQRKQEQRQARTLKELVRLGVEQGMKNPAGWAAHRFCVRKYSKPTSADFHEAGKYLQEIRNERRNSVTESHSYAPL